MEMIENVSSSRLIRYDTPNGAGHRWEARARSRAWRRFSTMGIVSYCPKGHRTKLKDRYAGLRIRCPTCGMKYWVDKAQSVTSSLVSEPMAASVTDPMASTVEAESSPLPEPIATAPEAVWCIALPGGEPSDSLPAAAMQAWLASGKATGNELVWRSDWTEWKPIGQVFSGSLDGNREVGDTALSVPAAAGSGTIEVRRPRITNTTAEGAAP